MSVGWVFVACVTSKKNKQQKVIKNKDNFFLSFVIVFNVLWLEKGDFPENVHTVCPCQNKQAFV